MIKGFARKYFEGKKCLFCDKYGLYRLADKRVKCKHCLRYYSLSKLKRELQILYYFYLEISARKSSKEMKINYRQVHRKFMQFRKCIFNYSEQQIVNHPTASFCLRANPSDDGEGHQITKSD